MFNIGKIIYKVYYSPLGKIKKVLKQGVYKTLIQEKGRLEMKRASYSLQEKQKETEETAEVFFLTGKKYWYQTAFCLYSLQENSDVRIKATFIDDGSFDDTLHSRVCSQFPSASVIRREKLLQILDTVLPEAKFPAIRKRRLEYPHLRKLTDIHILGGDDWKLVLDSDMLFFNRPTELLNWCKSPKRTLFMEDIEESYGYPTSYLIRLSGTKEFPSKLNVGVAGIASSMINWNEIEFWVKDSIERYGSSYLQEQGLTAVLAAKEGFQILPRETYKVLPVVKETRPEEILHHYVANSKYDYFVKGWKLAL